jgi:outer membrane protein assembly factor BamB
MTCVDKTSSEILWTWGDEDVTSASSISALSGIYTDGDQIFVNTNKTLLSIDAVTGVNRWKELSEGGCFGKRANLIGDYMYHSHDDCYPYETAGIVRCPVTGGTFDTLIMFNMVNNYEIFLNAPSLSVKPNGDSLLIFRLGSFNFTLSVGRQDLIAFNLATNQIEWRMDEFEPTGDCNVRPVTIYDSKVYVMGKYTLHCFDANTGEKLWEKAEPGGLMGSTSVIVVEGKVILKPDSNRLIAFDPTTGTQLWKVESSVNDANGMAYYDGHIFVTGATPDIFVHRISDGKLVYRKNMLNRDLYHPLAIDPATGLLFTSDGRNALCFKIDL